MTQTQVTGQTAKSEVLGEWTTDHGNRLTLMARRATGYASIWLNHHGKPVKIGYVIHAGGVVREVRWQPLWSEQTDAWKTQQRNHIAAFIAAYVIPAKLVRHARQRTLRLATTWPWAAAFTLCWKRIGAIAAVTDLTDIPTPTTRRRKEHPRPLPGQRYRLAPSATTPRPGTTSHGRGQTGRTQADTQTTMVTDESRLVLSAPQCPDPAPP